ncbi:winged helix-turn-helix domain-containing protein [Croceicoccus sp. Ery5]|uniref:winged helix-turn-helix domain-containing tetratricopeptide repeat protein n=1 Tax=Croceicoccus sp. Ery5 TaxID=1703340 RepID=UPI001E638F08|nr:winged helix-turn-helix domain-containing protein [Croceicoccus sp. Ery5]
MIYRFDDFTLDEAKFVLLKGGIALDAEPQVLSLLILLAGNADRLLTRDEIIEKVWNGRIVSDAAISSRIKSARRLLGDDGRQQRYIATVHGIGFRFAGHVRVELPATPRLPVQPDNADAGHAEPPPRHARPSIAVLPFTLRGDGQGYASMADALPHEMIAELSRLRWLFVIARGSTFRFRGQPADAVRVGQVLGVRYALSGEVEIARGRLGVTVELADTEGGAVIWGERYEESLDAVHDIRSRIVKSVIAALEVRISAHEAQRARLMATDRLDAWAAYHLGLEQIYRYNRSDNLAARAFFERAIALDPEFARAHAGLAFTRFQEGFMRYRADVDASRHAARAAAERAVALDPLDPFVNLVMGRVQWIEGDLDGSLAWLARSTKLSPNYAQAVYVSGLTQTLTGAADPAIDNLDLALGLSPLDPLRYGMLSSRGMANILSGNLEEAIRWSEMAVHSPGAHKHIPLVAAVARDVAGDREKAAGWVARARSMDPDIRASDFLRSFPFSSGEGRRIFSEALARHSL